MLKTRSILLFGVSAGFIVLSLASPVNDSQGSQRWSNPRVADGVPLPPPTQPPPKGFVQVADGVPLPPPTQPPPKGLAVLSADGVPLPPPTQPPPKGITKV